MLIINNGANYAGMPVYGNIAAANHLVFGLRATNPSNTVNLSSKAGKAGVTANTATYTNQGLQGAANEFVQTDFAPTDVGDMTIKAVADFKDLPIDTTATVPLLGDYNGNTGTAIVLRTIANGSNFDYQVRFFVAVKTASGAYAPRSSRIDVITNAVIPTTGVLNIWARINTVAGTVGVKVDNQEWVDLRYSDSDYADRGDGNWQIGSTPEWPHIGGTKVVTPEVLVWDKLLSSAEIEQQNKLSQRWLSTIA